MKFTLWLVLWIGWHAPALCAETLEERDLSASFGSNSGAFVLYDAAKDHWLRHNPAQCQVRSTPCSTFKVPNALLALETGVADGADFLLRWDGNKRPIED